MTPLCRLLVIAVGAWALACSDVPDREQPVGRTAVLYSDDTRSRWNGDGDRPLATTIWYPAVADAEEVEWKIGVFRAGWNAPDAEIAETPRRLPLVVLSHGTGGAAMQLSWLAEHLASHGYLVAAVNHHGNTGAEDVYLPQGFALWWERARDVSVVLDRLLADERFGPRIDPERIGVAGFSLGGYTVLTVAGARTDRQAWEKDCEGRESRHGCALPPEAPFTEAEVEALFKSDPDVRASLARSGESYADPRVRAAYAMAPVLGPALDPGSLAAISIPVRMVVGADDDQADPAITARPVAETVPGARLEVLPGVGHYVFLAECSLKGRLFVGALCDDGSTSRRDVHRRVAADALAFFEEAL